MGLQWKSEACDSKGNCLSPDLQARSNSPVHHGIYSDKDNDVDE